MCDALFRDWVRMFSEVCNNVHDEAQTGWPSLVSDDLVKMDDWRVNEDRRCTISSLQANSRVQRLLIHLKNHLTFCKVCAHWVPWWHSATLHCTLNINSCHLDRSSHLDGSTYLDGYICVTSPGLASNDFHLILHLKRLITEHHFHNQNDLKVSMQGWLTV